MDYACVIRTKPTGTTTCHFSIIEQSQHGTPPTSQNSKAHNIGSRSIGFWLPHRFKTSAWTLHVEVADGPVRIQTAVVDRSFRIPACTVRWTHTFYDGCRATPTSGPTLGGGLDTRFDPVDINSGTCFILTILVFVVLIHPLNMQQFQFKITTTAFQWQYHG